MKLDKDLPVASGIGGGSADAAAALRLLISLWRIDPKHAGSVAPALGSDVPACLLSLPMRGDGAGDRLTPIDFAGAVGKARAARESRACRCRPRKYSPRWDGEDRGPLSDWREGRNDLEGPARALVPQIGDVLAWLSAQPGARFARMSGSGATCFALFDDEEARDSAAEARSARVVAPGELPALGARAMTAVQSSPPSDARSRAGGDRWRNERRAVDGAGRGGAGGGGLSVRRADARADLVRAGKQRRGRLRRCTPSRRARVPVRVAAMAEPKSDAAKWARVAMDRCGRNAVLDTKRRRW